MGLSVEVVRVLDDLPYLKVVAQQKVASLLLSRHEWGPDETAIIEQALEPFTTLEGRAKSARGLVPRFDGAMVPLICSPPYAKRLGVVPPPWAVPQFFRNIPPDELMFRWPDPVDGLSAEAFDKLESLDPFLEEVFMDSWYASSGLPKRAGRMACLVATRELHLLDAPFTTLPSVAEILSSDALELYRGLTTKWRDSIEHELGSHIVTGEIRIPSKSSQETQSVYTYGTPPSEFLEALGEWADHRVGFYACYTDSEGNFLIDAACAEDFPISQVRE